MPMDTLQHLAPPAVIREDREGGVFVLRSPQQLGAHAASIGEWLDHWAERTPDAPYLAERAPDGGWRRLGYAQARQAVGAIAQGLLDLQLPAGRPLVVLSDNAVDHALLMLAGLYIGQPVCTVSSAYSRLTQDHTRIRGIVAALQPALLYASDAAVYGRAVAACDVDVPMVFSQGAATLPGAIGFDRLLAGREGPAVRSAHAAVRPEHHAKYLLTSGSTGQPKVVINTHRMLCANQQMIAQVWRFLDLEKPVVLDWLPWSHTFGGNHNFNLVLRNGGSLVIDEGRPAPQAIEATVRNLREVQPTLYFNVPRGFDMLLPYLEGDDALAAEALARMRMVFYAGAALPQSTWDRLNAVARKVRAAPLWFTTSWGATETSPTITSAHWSLERAGVIGLPVPGMELKFLPNGGKLEMRVRGPSVFPGYRDAPEQTAQAFDEEGFYRIADAGRLVDPQRPEAGVIFDGRVAEDFKLGSGTWVSVGTLRPRLISALAPLVQDAVITGHDRDEVGALLFLTAEGRALQPQALRAALAAGLARLKAEGGGSSQCPARLLVLDEPPSVDHGEITDKGYLNQRAVLSRREVLVQALHAQPVDARVVLAA